MSDFFQKYLGGLNRQYFFRHLFFGLCITVLFSWGTLGSSNPDKILNIIWFVVSGFLYPYSRFLYESIVGFFVGENVFIVNAFLMLVAKLMTMLVCWFFAVFIAPIGFIWLYFHNAKNNKVES